VKKLFALALLLAATSLPAQQIVVFGERDFCVLDSKAASHGPMEPDRIAFLEDFRADLARKAPYEEAVDLVNPPAW
jgi:hypothetical protein